MKRRFGGEPLPVWMPGNSRTAGCGSYVAGGRIVLRPDAGAAGAGKKRTAAGKKVTQLSFCMKNPVTGKVSCRRIGFDCIGRSADKWGSFVQKRKGSAEFRLLWVLVNLRHRKTTHTLPGEVVQGVFKKFTRFRADKYNRLCIRYVKNACNTVYRITKVINFSQSATTCLYWGRAAESIAEKRLWGLWSPYDLWCVPYDLRTVCLALSGFTKQAASRREAACLCCLWNAYSLRGVTLT